MKDKTRRRLMAMLMAVVMLGGVLAARSPVEARTWNKYYAYWKVLGKGTNHEIAKTYFSGVLSSSGEDRFSYFRILPIKEAIALGATEAYHIEGNTNSLTYAAIIKAKNTAGVDLQNSFYCPIKVTGKITEDGINYVVDDAGYRLRDNTGNARGDRVENGLVPARQVGDFIQDYISMPPKQAAKHDVKQTVFGIKGYVGTTKKPALCAAVGGNSYHSGNTEDDRYFLYTETYSTRGISSVIIRRGSNIYPELEALEPGYTKELCIEVTNSSKTKNATGVRLYFSKIPSTMKKGEILKFTAKLTGNNVMQSPIKNTIEFVAAEDIRIKKVYCAGWKDTCTSNFATRKESKKFFTKVFSKQGALVGYRGVNNILFCDSNFNGIIAPFRTANTTTSGFWGEHLTLEIEKLK